MSRSVGLDCKLSSSKTVADATKCQITATRLMVTVIRPHSSVRLPWTGPLGRSRMDGEEIAGVLAEEAGVGRMRPGEAGSYLRRIIVTTGVLLSNTRPTMARGSARVEAVA